MAIWDSRLLRDLIALAGGDIASKVAGFLAFAYLAHALGPEAYGAVELAVALSVFFSFAIDLGYGTIGTREVSSDSRVAHAYSARIISARIVTAILCIPIMGAVGHLAGQDKDATQLIWCFAVGLLAVPWNQRWLMQGLDLMKWVAFGQVIRMTVFAVGVLMLVHTSADLSRVGVVEIVSAYSMAATYLLLTIRIIGPIRFDFDIRSLLALNRQSVSAGLIQIAGATNQYVPFMLIPIFSSRTELAWFGAASRIVISLLSFFMIYHLTLYPLITKRIRHSQERFFQVSHPSVRLCAWVGSGVALSFTLTAESIVTFVFGSQFVEATRPLQILAWAAPIMLLSGNGRCMLVAGNKQKYALYAQAIGTLVTVVSCFVLVPYYHATGACVAMVVSSLTVWAVTQAYVAKFVGPVPFLRALPLPILSSVLTLVIANHFEYTWLGLSIGMLAYLLIPLAVYPPLYKDIRQLAHAKNVNLDAEN